MNKYKFTVQCDKCKETFDVEVDRSSFESEVEDPDRQMGQEIIHWFNEEYECSCGNTISVSINVWEYPVNAYNYHEVRIKGASTEKNIEEDDNLSQLLSSICQESL